MRCVFFDRDGIVNEEPAGEYVTRQEDFHLIPEFPECLRIAAAHGYRSAVVTNQRCVARGLLTRAALEDMHARLLDTLRRQNVPPLLDIIYCPHNPGECDCRKPQPGMLLQLAARHGIDLAQSWMIGDRETDVETGHRAGCRTIRVHADPGPTAAEHAAPDMRALPPLLERVLSGL